LGEALAADQVQLEELAGLYATGQVTAREWMAARNPIEGRIRDTQRLLAHATEPAPSMARSATWPPCEANGTP